MVAAYVAFVSCDQIVFPVSDGWKQLDKWVDVKGVGGKNIPKSPNFGILKARLFGRGEGGGGKFSPTGQCWATLAGLRPGGSSSFIEEWILTWWSFEKDSMAMRQNHWKQWCLLKKKDYHHHLKNLTIAPGWSCSVWQKRGGGGCRVCLVKSQLFSADRDVLQKHCVLRFQGIGTWNQLLLGLKYLSCLRVN